MLRTAVRSSVSSPRWWVVPLLAAATMLLAPTLVRAQNEAIADMAGRVLDASRARERVLGRVGAGGGDWERGDRDRWCRDNRRDARCDDRWDRRDNRRDRRDDRWDRRSDRRDRGVDRRGQWCRDRDRDNRCDGSRLDRRGRGPWWW